MLSVAPLEGEAEMGPVAPEGSIDPTAPAIVWETSHCEEPGTAAETTIDPESSEYFVDFYFTAEGEGDGGTGDDPGTGDGTGGDPGTGGDTGTGDGTGGDPGTGDGTGGDPGDGTGDDEGGGGGEGGGEEGGGGEESGSEEGPLESIDVEYGLDTITLGGIVTSTADDLTIVLEGLVTGTLTPGEDGQFEAIFDAPTESGEIIVKVLGPDGEVLQETIIPIVGP
jgi:hypothetical protein